MFMLIIKFKFMFGRFIHFDKNINYLIIMDPVDGEMVIFIGRCKCCLNDGDLKNLWTPYTFEGETEIYGMMLTECFALSWQQPEENLGYMDMICTSCISRLRDALAFKREVLVSEEVMREKQDELFLNTTVKVEKYLEEEEEETEFKEVEYLDITDSLKKDELYEESLSNEQSQSSEENRKRKWPKKLPRKDRNKTYKQYTEKAMRMAIDAVENKGLSCHEASEMFKVPRNTLALRVQNTIAKKEEPDDDEASKVQEKHYKLVEEIKSILTYTNAIPYKTRLSKYYCAYCSTDGPVFDEPDDLRTHTKTKHVDERTKGVDLLMRPHCQNEVLKVDIHSLHCTVCCTILPTWNDMFRHLEDVHEVVLDEAYSRVIPFILARELKCALCEDAFPNYQTLDGHMNAHYSSYICSECGDTFLSASRFNKHMEVHNTGTFTCEVCGKVYNLKKYLRKHFDLVHGQKDQYKCSYCPERFIKPFQRHQHVLEKHKETVKIRTCEICGKSFDFMPYFRAHMRRRHGQKINYK